MAKSEKEYGARDIVVALVILAAAILVGYQVVSSNSKSNDKGKEAAVQTAEEPKVEPAPVPDGWTTYNSNGQEMSFHYPPDWKLTKSEGKPDATKPARVATLRSPDGSVSAAFTLIQARKGQQTKTSLDDWKNQAANNGLEYSELWEIQSPYTSFGYTWNMNSTPVLSYEVLGVSRSASLTVIPGASPDQKAILEQIVSTVRF